MVHPAIFFYKRRCPFKTIPMHVCFNFIHLSAPRMTSKVLESQTIVRFQIISQHRIIILKAYFFFYYNDFVD